MSGNLTCGQCLCNSGKIGEKCECSDNDGRMLYANDTTSCKTNSQTNEICSGRGICKCGVCECFTRNDPNEKISGKFCECDNFSCERVDESLCSGHGTCKCGKCACNKGWSGKKCECSLDEKECMSDENDLVCSGKGNCVCGKCHCHNGTDTHDHRYSGKYCQNCMVSINKVSHV